MKILGSCQLNVCNQGKILLAKTGQTESTCKPRQTSSTPFRRAGAAVTDTVLTHPTYGK
jgi:hypothetical protein